MKFSVFSFLILSVFTTSSWAALSEGDIVEDFSLAKHGGEEGETFSLYDYAGHVIVLDFFAYWCGPCQTSSPKIEKEIADHYAEMGGTANGIPVTVIAVSVDNSNPSAVNSFVEGAGLKLVGLDNSQRGWRQFSQRYIPHFAVVNGVAGSNFEQWEVLYTNYGYKGSNFYKNIAETVELTGGFETWADENIPDSNSRGVLDDFDNDGLSNLLEYACGTNPEACDGHSALELRANNDGNYLVEYIESNSALGLETQIQTSNDLQTWAALPSNLGTRSETDLGEQTQVLRTIPVDSLEAKFWRRIVRQVQ